MENNLLIEGNKAFNLLEKNFSLYDISVFLKKSGALYSAGSWSKMKDKVIKAIEKKQITLKDVKNLIKTQREQEKENNIYDVIYEISDYFKEILKRYDVIKDYKPCYYINNKTINKLKKNFNPFQIQSVRSLVKENSLYSDMFFEEELTEKLKQKKFNQEDIKLLLSLIYEEECFVSLYKELTSKEEYYENFVKKLLKKAKKVDKLDNICNIIEQSIKSLPNINLSEIEKSIEKLLLEQCIL